MTMQHGTFHWNELMTRDVAAAKEFYGKTLGWTVSGMPMPEGTYFVFQSGESMVGGMMDMNAPQFEGMPPHWFAYIAVDDIDARIKQAKAEGAKVLREPFDVDMAGRIAIIQDPTGAAIGWMTPNTPASS